MSHAASTADASKVCPVSIIAVFVPKQTAVQAMANWTRCCCVASFALLLLWARFADAAPVTPCLPHAIPESARKNVVVDGESMPLGIWTSSFDSATIVSKIYEIIAQDSSDIQVTSVGVIRVMLLFARLVKASDVPMRSVWASTPSWTSETQAERRQAMCLRQARLHHSSPLREQVFKLAGCDHDSVEMTNVRNCGPPRRGLALRHVGADG